MPSLLIIAATDRELCPVDGVKALSCGIGPVEATVATARVLAAEQPSALLHVGIAGAASLEPGTVVVGSESIYCDVAVLLAVLWWGFVGAAHSAAHSKSRTGSAGT